MKWDKNNKFIRSNHIYTMLSVVSRVNAILWHDFATLHPLYTGNVFNACFA